MREESSIHAAAPKAVPKAPRQPLGQSASWAARRPVLSGLFSTEAADVLRRRRRGVVRPAWRPDRGPRRWDCEASVREHAREEEQGPAYEQDGAWHHRPDHTTKTRGDGSQMLQSAMLQKPVTNVWCRGVICGWEIWRRGQRSGQPMNGAERGIIIVKQHDARKVVHTRARHQEWVS